MNYLQKEEIIFINRKTIERHGGNFIPPDNILNENPLDYLVEAVGAEMFGEPLYPTIWDKAAVYYQSLQGIFFRMVIKEEVWKRLWHF